MSETTEKCKLCNELYVQQRGLWGEQRGDQSACPKCKKKARENMTQWEKEPDKKDNDKMF